MRVLVAEDDDVLADAIARGLRQQALSVDVALDGEQALDPATLTRYDVIVLDRDLPELHGDEVCRRLVAGGDGTTRILMLTAAATVRDRVSGLNLGADDYPASRSPSTSWWPGCTPWSAGPPRPGRRWWSAPASGSTRRSGWSCATGGSSGWRRRSSPCCTCCWPPAGR
jgi:CheY-like chemotaxis protein